MSNATDSTTDPSQNATLPTTEPATSTTPVVGAETTTVPVDDSTATTTTTPLSEPESTTTVVQDSTTTTTPIDEQSTGSTDYFSTTTIVSENATTTEIETTSYFDANETTTMTTTTGAIYTTGSIYPTSEDLASNSTTSWLSETTSALLSSFITEAVSSTTTAVTSTTAATTTTLGTTTPYYYDTNSSEYQNYIEYQNERKMFESLKPFTDSINYYASPVVSAFGVALNIVCMVVFLSPSVKSTIYKYLLFNSAFDAVTLLMVVLRAIFKYGIFASYALYNGFFELYFFIYLSSVTLTCSNLLKIGFSLERILKLRRKCRWYTNPASFKWIMVVVVLFGLLSNSPVLIGYTLFSDTRPKHTYYFLTLNKFGKTTTFGVLLVLNAILLDSCTFVAVVVVNVMLLFRIKKNINRLRNMVGQGPASIEVTHAATSKHLKSINSLMNASNVHIESAERSRRKSTVFDEDGRSLASVDSELVDIEDLDDDEFSCEVILTDLHDLDAASSSTPAADLNNFADLMRANDSSTAPSTSRSANDSSPVAIATTQEPERSTNIKFKHNKEKEKWFNIEASKHNLSKMVFMISVLYIFGHLLFTICTIMLQVLYFGYYGVYMNYYFDSYFLLRFFMAIANIMLYLSLSLNFFIYLFFNPIFKSVFFKFVRRIRFWTGRAHSFHVFE